jgi:hypothetical protein
MQISSVLIEIFIYIVYMASAMIIAGLARDKGLFSSLYRWLFKTFKNGRVGLLLFSSLSGCMPIPGRAVASIGILEPIAPKDQKKRGDFGILAYLSTHHYYLWSPLEPAVIVPMAALGLTYSGFMHYAWPLLLVYLAWLTSYALSFGKISIDTSSIDTSSIDTGSKSWAPVLVLASGFIALAMGVQPYIAFPLVAALEIWLSGERSLKKISTYIKPNILAILIVSMFIGAFVKEYSKDILNLVGHDSAKGLLLTSVLAFFATWVMGSSSKYAGLVGVLVSAFGMAYMTYFLALEFCAYLLAFVTHKCVPTCVAYFGTRLEKFIWMLLPPVIGMLIVGILSI